MLTSFNNNPLIKQFFSYLKVTIRNLLLITIPGSMAFLLFFTVSANAYEFPPYEGLSLKIEGQIAEDYSNNVTFAPDNEDRTEELLTVLDLGMGIKYDKSRRSLALNGRLNRQMSTDTMDIENSSERVTANFQ
ncbi:MAG: hypothetical protein AB1499_12485, partial [Nitrospirota bacterium]